MDEFTRGYLNEAADEIDAAMFSGDAFCEGSENPEQNRKVLREWMARWERGLKGHEAAEELETKEE